MTPLKDKYLSMPNQPPEWKLCRLCNTQKLVEDFHADPNSADGRRSECAQCRAEDREREKDRKNSLIVQEIVQQLGVKSLEQLLEAPGGTDLPHAKELYQIIFRAAGGSTAYIRTLWSDFLAAKPGSRERLKFHEMILRYAMKLSDDGHIRKDVREMSTEDLRKVLREELAGLGDAEQRKRIVDGKLVEFLGPDEEPP